MEIGLEQKLHLLLTPQMRQSMQVLQMNNLELAEYIQNLTLENPAMETETPKNQEDEAGNDQIFDKMEWLDSVDENNRGDGMSSPGSDDSKSFDIPSPIGETLGECLHMQLLKYGFNALEQRIADRIIQNLDENGYLVEPVSEIAFALHVKIDSVEKMLHMIQRLEPTGVGARTLCECLSIQLAALGAEDGIAYRIVQSFLEDLSYNRIKNIAEHLNCSIDEVAQARLLILSLDPKPGKSFLSSSAQYIVADVVIEKSEGRYVPFINDGRIPTIQLSAYYRQLARRTNDAQVRDYLGAKFKQTSWVVKCIEQRNRTILSSCEKLIDLQLEFFEHGPSHLMPMTLSDIAESIGVHVSTVSRTFKGKYLQCAWGLFPFGFFLSNGLSNIGLGLTSPVAVKAMIGTIVSSENKKRPKSDDEIAALLKGKGVDISRRTIAKYRGEMEIPASIRRKEY